MRTRIRQFSEVIKDCLNIKLNCVLFGHERTAIDLFREQGVNETMIVKSTQPRAPGCQNFASALLRGACSHPAFTQLKTTNSPLSSLPTSHERPLPLDLTKAVLWRANNDSMERSNAAKFSSILCYV